MIQALGARDTAETLAFLGRRPLYNVFLEYLVRAGALGRTAGFHGYRAGGRLGGVMLIGPLGGTVLEVLDPDAYAPLAQAAREFPVRPLHLVGPEEVTSPFWQAYSALGARARWERREPFYGVGRRELRVRADTRLDMALEDDLEAIVENSALQHREDLRDDPFARDPAGFRERHRRDILEGRWWVLREGRDIAFQVHIGPENDRAVQVGGVMTPPELRRRGHAQCGMAAIVTQLLERRPSVTLFCDEANAPARALYEKLGFHRLFWYRSWLLDGD